MSDHVISMPASKTPVPVEKKTRTITLTNRAPVQINEDDWPVIAQGVESWEHPGCNDGHHIEIRVRKNKHWQYIVHANYRFIIEDNEDLFQQVRVGRMQQVIEDHVLWKMISDVGQEMLDRINNEKMKKYAQHAIDQCFANLPAEKR
jgi:hypothetical protein